MPEFVKSSRHGDVLVLEIDNPPVNALSPGVPEALHAALDAAEPDPGVAAIVVRGAGRTFVAGADITTLEEAAWGNEAAAPNWHDLLSRIEDCRKPVVMAIHGTALGGGLELAMAGHYRVAVASAQVGQPEVNLGIIPGAEGTQRLPRLAGVAKALDMCVTGKPIPAAEALSAGIIDEIAGDDLTAWRSSSRAVTYGRPSFSSGEEQGIAAIASATSTPTRRCLRTPVRWQRRSASTRRRRSRPSRPSRPPRACRSRMGAAASGTVPGVRALASRPRRSCTSSSPSARRPSRRRTPAAPLPFQSTPSPSSAPGRWAAGSRWRARTPASTSC